MKANDPIRKRIVINLDNPAGQMGGQMYRKQPKGRRWPKVVAVILILIFVGVLGLSAAGFFWWRHYQTTPAYSLALIIDAAQRDDMAAFQQQIDDDAIARNLVSDVTQKAQARYGIALSTSLQSEIDTLVPRLLPRLKDTIHQEVAKEIKEFASKSKPRPFIVVATAVPTLVSITQEGDNAKATAPMPDRKIELGLQRNGDRWKVTEFKDDVLVQRVVDSVMKDLPAIGSLELKIPLLKPVRKSRRR